MNFFGFMLIFLLSILGLSESKSEAYCQTRKDTCFKKCIPRHIKIVCDKLCNPDYIICLHEK